MVEEIARKSGTNAATAATNSGINSVRHTTINTGTQISQHDTPTEIVKIRGPPRTAQLKHRGLHRHRRLHLGRLRCLAHQELYQLAYRLSQVHKEILQLRGLAAQLKHQDFRTHKRLHLGRLRGLVYRELY